ncbi:hypothetical protein [Microviridae sp.]|nr:hypothetical protein [Microviridae sp.]
MEPIDKVIIRIIILTLGSIFGVTALKHNDNMSDIAKNIREIKTLNAGLVPLPTVKK